MNSDRRTFLKWIGTAGCAAFAGADLQATPSGDHGLQPSPDWMGVLVDTTLCIGCRKCEWACNKANRLPVRPLETFEDKSVFARMRRPTAGAYTMVNRYEGFAPNGGPIDVKVQCFHCNEPACWSACLVTAFTKQANGAVTYDPHRCMGCRYCMVACPFQIPAYEYHNALSPQVRKCTFCFERTREPEGIPGCVEICPVQCLTYGKRTDLLEIARQKIAEHPGKYVDHIYGEREAGGTSWLYLSSVPFEKIGFVKLGPEPVPRLTESIQHGIFRWFVPPLSLYALLGGIMKLTGERDERPGDDAEGAVAAGDGGAGSTAAESPGGGRDEPPEQGTGMPSHKPEPVVGRLMTPGAWFLVVLMAMAGIAGVLRFWMGIGAVTHLDNQYPWGIWIGIDVATGVALAAGGFTTAALAHIFHRERYRAIVRPALLTALLGYTFVAISLLFDLGKYYNIWHPILPEMWSGHSVLFEVGMCVTLYLFVLYTEFLPILCERFIGRVNLPGPLSALDAPVDGLLRALHGALDRTMSVFIIAGVVLSCLHQSSLGSLMLIAPSKMNPLWWTPILPLLFLLSAVAVGFPMVIFESILAARTFGRRPEMEILSSLAKMVPVLLGTYLAFKVGDMVIRGSYRHLTEVSFESVMFAAEMIVGVILPLVLFFSRRVRHSRTALLAAATLVVLGVVLNRINVFITAYDPPYDEARYVPALGEIAVTVGLFAALLFCYRLIVLRFPVLSAPATDAGRT